MRETRALWALIGLLAAVAVIAIIAAVSIERNQNRALHSIICFVDAREQRTPTLTAKEKKAAGLFWRHALEAAHLPYCF